MLAYLKRIGFLHGRLVEEATRKKTPALATISEDIVVSEDDPVAPDVISAPDAPTTQSLASRPVRDRLLEIQALGLGERSFTNPNSPFLGGSSELVVRFRQGRTIH